MFDIDAGKILVVGVVALLVIGPKDLPRVLRTVGKTVGQMRRMASEFQNQFMEAVREADLEDVKKEINAINESAQIDATYDPASVMREEVTAAIAAPSGIAPSSVDLTGSGPMKEPASGPVDAQPQGLLSLATGHSLGAAPEMAAPGATTEAPVAEAAHSVEAVPESDAMSGGGRG